MCQYSECFLLSIKSILDNLNEHNEALILSLLEHHINLHKEELDYAINDAISISKE
jgi:hypothetical protein